MTTLDGDAPASHRLRSVDEVAHHIRTICFKTGPPSRVGVELEWTAHHAAAPTAPIELADLRLALGRHAPATLDPARPPLPLPAGGTVTLEPGGQVEISSAPAPTLAALHAAVTTEHGRLTGMLADAGLQLGEHGIDPHRGPRRVLDTPRYAAMERMFDAQGPCGRVMMCSTAGLQVCLDAGPATELATRWAAVTALGPPLVATFANSARHAGRHTGFASARMAAWWGIDPRISRPFDATDDPASAWARYALAAPLLCVRRDGGCWEPPGFTLGDWLAGALPEPPTTEDVDYHLSTLFPPVRPRGYLEVRYLDAQADADWIVPVAVLVALLGGRETTEAALQVAAPVADRWVPAYRIGLGDRPLRRAAAALVDLAGHRLAGTGLPPAVQQHVMDTVERRLHDADRAEESR